MSVIKCGSRVSIPVNSRHDPERELGTVRDSITIEGDVRGYSVQPDSLKYCLVYRADECELIETPVDDDTRRNFLTICANLNSIKPDRENALEGIRNLARRNENGVGVPDFLKDTGLNQNGIRNLLHALENFFS